MRIVFITVLICILPFSNTFAFDEIDETMKNLEGLVQENDVVFRELLKFKKKVQENAFTTTLKLCSGYRKSIGLDPRPSPYTSHIRKYSKFKKSVSGSKEAWDQLKLEGFLVPYDSIFGLKADYNSYLSIPTMDLRNWYGSLYALILVNSTGFLLGAQHCLNTDDPDDLENFAHEVLLVDALSTGFVYSGFTSLFGWGIFRVLAFTFTRLTGLFTAIKAYVAPNYTGFSTFSNGVSSLVKKDGVGLFTFLTLSTVTINSASSFGESFENTNLGAEETITPNSDFNTELRFNVRFAKLNKAHELAIPAIDALKSKGDYSDHEVNLLYCPMLYYLAEHFESIDLEKMALDKQEILKSSQEDLSEAEKRYIILIDNFLPFLDSSFVHIEEEKAKNHSDGHLFFCAPQEK